jgi:type III restriction enzyme
MSLRWGTGSLRKASNDFLVCTADAVYLVETKAQQQTIHPNVQRKLKAAMAWCERINGLDVEQRGSAPWALRVAGGKRGLRMAR